METRNERIENAMNVKVSDETKKMLIALTTFEESFWDVCNVLTIKDENEKIQEAYRNIAEKEQAKAKDAYYKVYGEFEEIVKDRMFQMFFDTDCKEI